MRPSASAPWDPPEVCGALAISWGCQGTPSQFGAKAGAQARVGFREGRLTNPEACPEEGVAYRAGGAVQSGRREERLAVVVAAGWTAGD